MLQVVGKLIYQANSPGNALYRACVADRTQQLTVSACSTVAVSFSTTTVLCSCSTAFSFVDTSRSRTSLLGAGMAPAAAGRRFCLSLSTTGSAAVLLHPGEHRAPDLLAFNWPLAKYGELAGTCARTGQSYLGLAGLPCDHGRFEHELAGVVRKRFRDGRSGRNRGVAAI